jgi:NADH/NAD ratio-sensing transcriptional regulator Rex
MILGLDRTVRVAFWARHPVCARDYPDSGRKVAIVAFRHERSESAVDPAGTRIRDISEFRRIVRREHIDIGRRGSASPRRGVMRRCRPASGPSSTSPGSLKVPPAVKLKNVDLTVSLESLSFFLAWEGQHAKHG